MTSIHTNIGAMAAFQTLRSIGSNMETAQRQTSSGLRVETASDNAAYWSISTTMRSHESALSSVSDALGLSAALLDTATAGMVNTIDILSAFKARLVAAREPGIDRDKVQSELEQLKAAAVRIAESASFSGENWLSTDVDLFDTAQTKVSLVSSFTDNGSDVRVNTLDLDVADLSLLNNAGGGTLQADPRSPGMIGGLRTADLQDTGTDPVLARPSFARYQFGGSGFVIGSPIEFDIAVDGAAPVHMTIDKPLVDAVLGASTGAVTNITDWAIILQTAFDTAGVDVTLSVLGPNDWVVISDGTPPENTEVTIENVTPFTTYSAIGQSGWILSKSLYTTKFYAAVPPVPPTAASDSFVFSGPFSFHPDAKVSFEFQVDFGAATTVTIDRSMVDAALGTTDGEITDADDLAAILDHALSGYGVTVGADPSGVIAVESNTVGAGSQISLGEVADNKLFVEVIDVVERVGFQNTPPLGFLLRQNLLVAVAIEHVRVALKEVHGRR